MSIRPTTDTINNPTQPEDINNIYSSTPSVAWKDAIDLNKSYFLSDNLIINIPSDVATLQDAVDQFSFINPNGFRIILNLENTYNPESGILVKNGNYSYFSVTSAIRDTEWLYLTDDVNYVVGETISQAVSGATGIVFSSNNSKIMRLHTIAGTFVDGQVLTGSISGALGANSSVLTNKSNVVFTESFSGNFIEGQNAQLPELDCLIGGDGTSDLFDGYYAKFNSSGVVTKDNGILGCWGTSCRCYGPSTIEARKTVWIAGAQNGLNGAGIHTWGGKIFAEEADTSYSGYYGAQASHGGTLSFRRGIASEAYRHGIRASDAAILDADNAITINCGKDNSGSNIRSYEGSAISFVNGIASGGYNCFYCSGGQLNLRGAVGIGSSFTDAIFVSGIVYTNDITNYITSSVLEALILGNKSGNIKSGVYTPIATIGTNISSVTPSECHYTLLNNMVMVSGNINVDPILGTDVLSDFELSLPIITDISAFREISGSGNPTTDILTQKSGLGILGNTVTNRAKFVFLASEPSSVNYSFIFTYVIL